MFIRSILYHKQFRFLGAFYLHSLIRHFASSIFQIFNSIYVFQTFQKEGLTNPKALGLTAIFFGLVFLFQAIFIPLSVWLIKNRGLKFNIMWGNLILILFLISLYLSQLNIIFLVPSFILGGLQIALYWTAYHIYFSKISDDKKQGEEVALGLALSIIVGIGGPTLGGVLISFWGFGAMFAVISTLLVISNIPLRKVSKQQNSVNVNLLEIYKIMSERKERRSYLAITGEAVIDVVDLYLWPLTVFLILTGYIALGLTGSIIAFVASVITMLLGYLIDKFGPKAVLNFISSLDSLVWISKAFVATPFQVYAASAAQGSTISGQYLSLQSMIYERTRHKNSITFILEREFTLSGTKFIFMLVLGILFWIGFPLEFSFILAAAAALFTRFYPASDYARMNHNGKSDSGNSK